MLILTPLYLSRPSAQCATKEREREIVTLLQRQISPMDAQPRSDKSDVEALQTRQIALGSKKRFVCQAPIASPSEPDLVWRSCHKVPHNYRSARPVLRLAEQINLPEDLS